MNLVEINSYKIIYSGSRSESIDCVNALGISEILAVKGDYYTCCWDR